MSRLPIPGLDNGTWGNVLNDFLGVEHNADGSLKITGSLAGKANDSTVVHQTGAETVAGVKTFTSPPAVPMPAAANDAAPKNYVDAADAASASLRLGAINYEYPSQVTATGWNTLRSVGNEPTFVVANPASGPGVSQNSDWLNAITLSRTAGIKVLGYVTTDGGSGPGTRSLPSVTADIDTWDSFYTLDGYFFDTTPTGANGDKTAYFASICDYAHAKGAGRMVVVNPGAYPLSRAYVDKADTVCVHEGAYSSYLSVAVDSWATAYVQGLPASKFMHLVYSVPGATEMALAMAHAASLDVGWFYAASTGGSWIGIPSYYSAEVVAARHTHPPLNPLDRSAHFGSLPSSALGYAVAGSSAAGDSAAVGLASTIARSDHTHDRAIDKAAAGLITTGEEAYSRRHATQDCVLTSGTMLLTYFTARKTETITQVTLFTGSTAAAGLTLAQIAIYSVDGSGNLTEVVATASDTSLFNATNSSFTKALSSSFAKVAGTQYVCAVLAIGTTVPSLVGSIGFGALTSVAPRLCGAVPGQASLPSSTAAGNVVADTRMVESLLLP